MQNITVYHGTDGGKLEDIVRDGGLVAPSYQGDDINWDEWPWEFNAPSERYARMPDSDAVYVTESKLRCSKHQDDDFGAGLEFEISEEDRHGITVYRGLPLDEAECIYLSAEPSEFNEMKENVERLLDEEGYSLPVEEW